MQRSFSYYLLITLFFIIGGCGQGYVQTGKEYVNIEVSDSSMPTDSQFVRAYQPYKDSLEKDMSRVISITKDVMIKNKPESNLTNFLGDLMLYEGEVVLKKMGKKFKPDISYFNYGGIRTPLPKGEITVGDIFELMPFENEMVFLKLKGDRIQVFLDIIASKGGESVGGVRFKIHNKKALKIEIGGRPLVLDQYYWLATNNYVASGGDGMEVFSDAAEFINSNRKIRDLIISNLEMRYEKGEVISAAKDGRISNE